MTPFTVRLTFSEIALAHQVAGQRMILALKNKQSSRFGAVDGLSNDRLRMDLVGCLGEQAVAKACNRYWSPAAGEIGVIDVGELLEVRSISNPDHSLILHTSDSDDLPYVLADVSGVPVVHIRGWIAGKDGKHEKFWCDPSTGRPAYFVPQSQLRQFDELLEQMAGVSA
jgi:hypothetical protein